MANWGEPDVTDLWEIASKKQGANRAEAFSRLFQKLKELGRGADAVQVGSEWLSVLDDGFATVDLFDCAFLVVQNLSEQERHIEAIDVVTRLASYPDIEGCDFERGLLFWQQSEDFKSLGMTCEQLQALEHAKVAFHDSDGPRGRVLFTIGSIQHDLGLFDQAKASLTEAILTSEEASESLDVAWSKTVLAEVLISEKHFSLAYEMARDATIIFEFLGRHSAKKQSMLAEARCLMDTDQSGAETLLNSLLSGGECLFERRLAAKALYYLGHLVLQGDREDEARDVFRRAEPILRSLGLDDMADQVP